MELVELIILIAVAITFSNILPKLFRPFLFFSFKSFLVF